MSYTSRKRLAGQEVVKKLTFYLNRCKFTDAPYLTYNVFAATNSYTSSYTGVMNTVTNSAFVSTWSPIAELYAKNVVTGELLKVSVTTTNQINIIARAQFGTTAAAILAPVNFEMWHKGRADSSCYGYSQTCSSPDSYQANLFKEIVFCTAPLRAGSIYHGGLSFKDINYSSAELKPGESISSRSKLSFRLSDQVHNDYELSFWGESQTSSGTLFGKLLARNPYFNGRKIRYSVGFREGGTVNEPDWEHRNFLIDSVNLSNEFFSGSALDPLILTENKKAKMPLASPAQLTAAITSGSATVQFGNAPANYFGTSGNIIVRIDSELIEVAANGSTTMSIITRGFGNSAIKDHSVNATVQNCIRFVNEHVVDCITYALTTWTDIPSVYIDNYSATIALIPTKIISDYTISSPQGVVDFINMCIFIGNLSFYFNDLTQKIVIKYISEFSVSPIYLSDLDSIRKESGKRDLNLKEQYTRFNLSWAPFDLTKDSDSTNYQVSITAINSLMESAAKLGEVNERKSMLLPMLTTSSADYLMGADAVNRIVSLADDAPDIFECELDAENVGSTQGSILELGSVVSLQSKSIQNKSGTATSRLYQILKIDGDPFEGFRVKMKHFQQGDPSSYDFIINEGIYINYVLTANFNPSTPGQYVIYIKAGAIFGSYNTTIAAFDTGTPAAGVTFKFIAKWQVLGMGGKGGNAGIPSSPSGDDGEEGGTAFEAHCDCEIDNGAGLIWAGGGGGGGLDYIPYISTPNGPTFFPRFGGGGGQGFGNAIGGFNTSADAYSDRAPSGNQASAGGGAGAHGGEWGADGEYGSNPLPAFGGFAIKSNGFIVTITSGDNTLSIRGYRE